MKPLRRMSLFDILARVLVGAFALLCLLPFWLVLAGSFTSETSILRNGYQFLPRELSLEAYQLLFTGQRLYRSYLVTVTVTVVGTSLSLLVTSMLAFTMSLRGVRYARPMAFFVFFTMLFSGGMVPWYILVSQYLKLSNSILGLILPMMLNAWFTLIMRNFFKGIPESILESARIDGSGTARILFQIALPLSGPALATIGLFYSLQYWNDWWLALMLVEKSDLFPLQFLLRALVSNLLNAASSLNPHMTTVQQPPAYSVRMATCIVTIGPIIFVYPFVQRYFIKGIFMGSIKG
jgi:putative aldouronate transport system permease protein